MKRRISRRFTRGLILVLVTTLALLLLTACGGGNISSSSINSVIDNASNVVDKLQSVVDSVSISSGDADEDFVYGNGTDYIADHLKGDFSITYSLSSSSGDSSNEITCIRTAEGYCLSSPATDVLYVKNGETYDIYFQTDNGYEKIDFLDPKSEKEVQSDLGLVFGFMSQYGSLTGLKSDGEETVAGRDCERYKMSVSVAALGVAAGATYSIDKETGVCLKFKYDVAGGGSLGSATFECTEFKTSGVTLPAYNG